MSSSTEPSPPVRKPGRTAAGRTILPLLTLAVLAATAWIWVVAIGIDGDPRYRYRPASLAELYIPARALRITGFSRQDRDRLTIRLAPEPPAGTRWTVRTDSGQPVTGTGPLPRLHLAPRLHTYAIHRQGDPAGPGFTVTIDYYPAELYAPANRTIGDTYRLVSASLPVGRYRVLPVSSFVGQKVTDREKIEVHRILTREIGVRPTDPDREKIEKIGRFLLAALDHRRGIPAPGLDPSPLAGYRCAVAGTSPIWCAQFADIYALFANTAGVPTRLVSAGGRLDGVSLSAHGFAESYLAETGRWAYVDLFSRVVLVEDRSGRPLNAVDLFMLLQAGGGADMTALAFRDGELARVPLAEKIPDLAYYLTPDTTLIFDRPRFVFLRPWRRVHQAVKTLLAPDLGYSRAVPAGHRHLLTRLLTWSCLALLLYWVLVLAKTVRQRRRAG